MSNLDDILKKKLKGMGIDRQVEAVGVVEAAQKEISKYISEEDFEVVSFKDGVLKIFVSSGSAASELSIFSNKIKGILNDADCRVQKIQIIQREKQSPY